MAFNKPVTQWKAKLTFVLLKSSFQQSKSDYSLHTKATLVEFIAILIFIDDLVLTGNDIHEIQCINKLLDDLFKIKTLVILNFSKAWKLPGLRWALLSTRESTLWIFSKTVVYWVVN